MKAATKITIATFGVINTIAAFEHGLGEVLQGNTVPESVFISSWPDSTFFQALAGEPAMTLIPNLLVSGILSIFLSLAFLAWATWLSDRRWAGPMLLLLSILLLLVGGGFGPPLFGIILGIALSLTGTRANKRSKNQAGWRNLLGRQWRWLFIAATAAWLLVFPGLNLLDFAMRGPLPDALIYTAILSAFVLLPLALLSASAKDRISPRAA